MSTPATAAAELAEDAPSRAPVGDGPLKTMLSLCENLHTTFSAGGANATPTPTVSSLRLLVPVHQSLCQAVLSTTAKKDAPTLLDSDSLGARIDAILASDEDASLCRDLLLSKEATMTTSKQQRRMMKQLAALQFILYSEPLFQTNRKQGLAKIVLPWLLEYLPLQYLVDDTNGGIHGDAVVTHNDAPAPLPPACLELLEALLDAVFASTSTSTSSSSLDGIQECLQWCLQDPNKKYTSSQHAEWTWTLQGRVLMRLHTWMADLEIVGVDGTSITGQAQGQVLQALTDKCLQAIKLGAASSLTSSSSAATTVANKNDMAAWLRPMTNDWLPYWLQHVAAESPSADTKKEGDSLPISSSIVIGVDQLWHCLWDTYLSALQSANKKADGSTPETLPQVPLCILSTTSILCTILPVLLDRNLPIPDTHQDATASVDLSTATKAQQQTCLWELIHTCLRQGIPRPPVKQTNADVVLHQQSQMLRRRGLFLLRLMLPSDSDEDGSGAMKKANSKGKAGKGKTDKASKGKGKGKKNAAADTKENPFILQWKKYVLVMETLEMETQHHLIEQVWETLVEIFTASHEQEQQRLQQDTSTAATPTPPPPPMNWHWTQLLLARVLTSYDEPIIRKLALYRFLNGQAGIALVDPSAGTNDAAPTNDGASKKAKAGKKGTAATGQGGAPLSVLTPDFVCEIVVVAFDSLLGSVGTNLNLDEDGQGTKPVSLIPLFSRFLSLYYKSLQASSSRDKEVEILRKIWYGSSVMSLRSKTIGLVWEAIAAGMADTDNWSLLEIDSEMLQSLVPVMQRYFMIVSVARVLHEPILRALSTMLSHTSTQKVDPKLVLQVLALFDSVVLDTKRGTTSSSMSRSSEEPDEEPDDLASNPIHIYLGKWLQQLGENKQDNNSQWITLVASTVSTAFVRGELLSSSSASLLAEEQSWEPISGASTTEREMARAIAYLCTLVGHSALGNPDDSATTAGGLLWPAIHKGIAHVPVAMVGTAWSKADSVTRALLLLEEGCRLQVLSGMGNGDLIVDGKSQQMMPPPPNVEAILASSVKFILHHISFLVAEGPGKDDAAGATRSGNAKKVSVTFANLISQVKMLHDAYPSSMAVSKTVDEMLEKSVQKLQAISLSSPGINDVRDLALMYATLSSGASLPESTAVVEVCQTCLLLEFQKIPGQKKSEEQMARSVFHFAKWGALSCLLPILLSDERENATTPEAIDSFLKDFRNSAFDAVHGIPADAMMAYFHCIKVAGQKQLTPSTNVDDAEVDHLLIGDFINALMALMEEKTSSEDNMYMLNEFCALIFQPKLLQQEYLRVMLDPVAGASPIRDAFQKLITLAGTARSHIAKVVLCHATAGWLGLKEQEKDGTSLVGMGAILYRNDIVDLLCYKEIKYDALATNQSVGRGEGLKGAFDLPAGVDDSSIGRGYLLMFISSLPDQDKMHPKVLSDLVHYIIFKMFEKICTEKGKKATLVMLGSDEYVSKIRGWQALCCLSRFVTDDIADQVSDRTSRALGEPLHQQIRYFIEVFTLQCARKHPAVFGKAILKAFTKLDIALTHITSVMIIAGNLTVGKYKLDFFTQWEEGAKREAVPINNILAGTIPWLGSTQGFSRGIAQLLTHMLIPLVVDVTVPAPKNAEAITEESNWFLLNIYRFLDENPEMKRLRKKQSNFFEQYDVDKACTPEGILSIPVDEGGEAFPVHMVDVMKKCQKETYSEAESREYPHWKQIEDMMKANRGEAEDAPATVDGDDALVNLQRKIIPLDELNLAMDTLKEKRLRNIAGRRKQNLVVCASLIDKVPNLGGLARTAEIFAAEKLIIPDIGVAKMDNFKTFSASAGDWIDIDECKEKVRSQHLVVERVAHQLDLFRCVLVLVVMSVLSLFIEMISNCLFNSNGGYY